MAKIKTLNQTLTVLEDVAQRHYQINGFGIGASWEIAASEEPLYPLLWVNPLSATMERGSNNNYAAFEVTIKFKILDLVNKDESNEDDVSSDTLQMLQDVITEFTTHPYYRDSMFSTTGDLSFTPLDEVTDEQCNGWEVDITFRTPYIASYCGLPISEIDGYEFPAPICTGVTLSNVTYISNIINTDGNIDITHTGTTYEINSTAITTNELAITNLDSNKYDKSGGTISGNVVITGTTNFQENIFFDDKGSTITSTGTTFDLSTGNIFINALSGATEMDYTNATVGTYIFEFNGQTTSSVLTFASGKFQSPDGTTPALTATAGAVDSLSMYWNGDKMIIFTANNILDL